MVEIKILLDQDLYPATEEILRACLKDGLGMYSSYSDDRVTVKPFTAGMKKETFDKIFKKMKVIFQQTGKVRFAYVWDNRKKLGLEGYSHTSLSTVFRTTIKKMIIDKKANRITNQLYEILKPLEECVTDRK